MAAQAQLTPPLSLPPPPTHLPRTSGAAGQLTLLIRRRGRGGGGRGGRGSCTRAEEEVVQRKIS